MPETVVTGPDGKEYTVTHPAGASRDQIIAYARKQVEEGTLQPSEPAPAPPPPGTNPGVMGTIGEFANAANRSFLEGLDYIGPGAVNAGLRLAGSDYQIPTLTGAFEKYVPGAQGGFMDPGLARDVVRGAGGALPAAAALPQVAGRNLATVPGAVAEITGFGSAQAPAATVDAAGALADVLQDTPRGAVKAAEDIGWPMSPGDRLQNEGMRRLESAIEAVPLPFNPMHRQSRQRQRMLNEAASAAIGRGRQSELSFEDLGETADVLGARFKSLELEDALPVTDEFTGTLADVADVSRKRLFSDPDIAETVDRVLGYVDDQGALAAIDYQDLSSQLKGKIRDVWRQGSPDPEYAEDMKRIVKALDDLAENSLDGAALAELKDARRKWKALTQLEKSRAVSESGDVSGPLLANYLRRTDKPGYARGGDTSELYQAARASKAFPGRPDSGTASRMLLQHPFAAALGGAGGGAGAATLGAEALALFFGAPFAGSALANAYYYGVPQAIRAARTVAPYLPGQPAARVGVTSRIPAWLEDEED